ncbi:MAG: hypothetical protein AVDCRST_MAG24-792, partial [uncultured Nocardioidaceae bacterium]
CPGAAPQGPRRARPGPGHRGGRRPRAGRGHRRDRRPAGRLPAGARQPTCV